TLFYRVDGRHVESGPGLHKGQPRLHPLLRRDVLRALPWRTRPPVRARLRPAPRPGEAVRAAALAPAADDLREFDERPGPQGRPGRLHRVGGAGHEARTVAYLPGAHQAVGAPARSTRVQACLRGF